MPVVNNKIVAPVNPWVVSKLIGMGSVGDVAKVCSSGEPYVNKWSKRKPIKLESNDTQQEISESRFVSENWGIMVNVTPNPDTLGLDLSVGSLWKYKKPDSTCFKRLTDFIDYNHKAYNPALSQLLGTPPFHSGNRYVKIATGVGDIRELMTYQPIKSWNEVKSPGVSYLNYGYLIGSFTDRFRPMSWYPISGYDNPDYSNGTRLTIEDIDVRGGAQSDDTKIDISMFGDGDWYFMATFTTADKLRGREYHLDGWEAGSYWAGTDQLIKVTIKEPVTEWVRASVEYTFYRDLGTTIEFDLFVQLNSTVTYSTSKGIRFKHWLENEFGERWPIAGSASLNSSVYLQPGQKTANSGILQGKIDKYLTNYEYITIEVSQSDFPSNVLSIDRLKWIEVVPPEILY